MTGSVAADLSAGTSELQSRDRTRLLRINAGDVDRAYLERCARRLGVLERSQAVG